MGGDRKVLALHLGEVQVESISWGASAAALGDVDRAGFVPRAFDQALREALQADHVLIVRAGGAPPGPDDRSLLSIPATTAPDERLMVHIGRRGLPFDERDARVARQIVGLMTNVIATCSQDGNRATVFVEDTLNRLDLMGSHSVEERLALVARNACHWFEGAGWSIGVLDGTKLVTLVEELPTHADRPDAKPFLAERTPITAQYVLDAFEGGSFVVTSDTDDDLGELVRNHGMRTLVAAGGYDVDAIQWLVAVLEGAESHDLRVARSALSATVQAALGFPRPPRSYGERLKLSGPAQRG